MALSSRTGEVRRDSAAVGALHEMASPNDLKRALQCPVCEEVPMPPIYTCSSGHTICGKCEGENLDCKICGEHLSNFSRNKAVEAIVASSSFWCKFMKDGCPKVIKGSDYATHADTCDFRRVNCFDREVVQCEGKPIRFKEYFKHLKTEHQVEGSHMRSNVMCMSEYSNNFIDGPWPSFFMEYEEEVFLRNMKVEKSILYMWFTMVGSDSDSANYRMKVSIYMKHSDHSRCDWTVPIYSVRKTPEEIEQSAFRIAIPCHQLELYCSQKLHPHGELYRFVVDLRYELIIQN